MFKGWNFKDLKFYYEDNVDVDKYPTFFHWLYAMKEQGEY